MKRNYVCPKTRVIESEVEPVMASFSRWCGGDCDECRDEWPIMPPDPVEDDDFLSFN